MRSFPSFLAVAALVTLSPGPAFALLLQVTAVHGRRAALANIAGNSVGVLTWGALSAVGVSALIAANRLAHDALHIGGAVFLVWLGARALWRSRRPLEVAPTVGADDPACRHQTAGWRAARKGLVNSLANPKLAVFFVALFPQFVAPGASVLPAALTMAAVIVALDVLWYGSVALAVDHFRQALRPHVTRWLERLSGVALVAFGLRLTAETPR